MSTDTLTDLLNKVSAIVKSGASTFPQLSRETKIPVGKLYEIVNQRRSRPNGERALALHKWAEKMTIEISKSDKKTQRLYRSEYREISRRFPVNGSRD